jgi:hypothetical protein
LLKDQCTKANLNLFRYLHLTAKLSHVAVGQADFQTHAGLFKPGIFRRQALSMTENQAVGLLF